MLRQIVQRNTLSSRVLISLRLLLFCVQDLSIFPICANDRLIIYSPILVLLMWLMMLRDLLRYDILICLVSNPGGLSARILWIKLLPITLGRPILLGVRGSKCIEIVVLHFRLMRLPRVWWKRRLLAMIWMRVALSHMPWDALILLLMWYWGLQEGLLLWELGLRSEAESRLGVRMILFRRH